MARSCRTSGRLASRRLPRIAISGPTLARVLDHATRDVGPVPHDLLIIKKELVGDGRELRRRLCGRTTGIGDVLRHHLRDVRNEVEELTRSRLLTLPSRRHRRPPALPAAAGTGGRDCPGPLNRLSTSSEIPR